MADWDDAIDDLYRNDPAEFVSARNALAKRVRTEGDRARAAEVAKLGRPTVVAWSLNRAVRDDPERVDALIDAAERQASAQSDLMAGGDRDGLRSATADRRAAADALVRMAAGFAGATHAAAAQNTLDAALVDPVLRERLRSGTLSETLSAPAGFGFGLDIDGAAADVVRRRARDVDHPPPDKARPDPDAEEAEKAEKAEKAAAAREEAIRVATAEVERLEAEASAAAEAATSAAEALDDAEDEVREAEDALAAARLAHARAAEALALAQHDRDRRADQHREARRALARLQDDDLPPPPTQ